MATPKQPPPQQPQPKQPPAPPRPVPYTERLQAAISRFNTALEAFNAWKDGYGEIVRELVFAAREMRACGVLLPAMPGEQMSPPGAAAHAPAPADADAEIKAAISAHVPAAPPAPVTGATPTPVTSSAAPAPKTSK